jgi:hypothetical protein
MLLSSQGYEEYEVSYMVARGWDQWTDVARVFDEFC